MKTRRCCSQMCATWSSFKSQTRGGREGRFDDFFRWLYRYCICKAEDGGGGEQQEYIIYPIANANAQRDGHVYSSTL